MADATMIARTIAQPMIQKLWGLNDTLYMARVANTPRPAITTNTNPGNDLFFVIKTSFTSLWLADQRRFAVNGIRDLRCSANNLLCLLDVSGRTVNHQQVLICFEGCVILDNAIFRNTDTHEPSSYCAHAPPHRGAFQRADDPGDQRTSHQDRPNARYGEERGAKEQAPESPPERADLAPALHAIAGVVIADDVFVRVCVFGDNGQTLHVYAGLLQFLDGMLCFFVCVVDGYNR